MNKPYSQKLLYIASYNLFTDTMKISDVQKKWIRIIFIILLIAYGICILLTPIPDNAHCY